MSNNPTIWLLEDSPTEAALTRRVLGANFQIELFTEGHVLLEQLSIQGPPALLVLDLQLPGMSGIDVCRAARELYDESTLPILILTVYGHKSDLVHALSMGANDYVTKPYDAQELAARARTLVRVRSLVDRAKVADEARAASLDREHAARAAAESANAAKDEFLAILSHELRTPLAAILGWTHMARTGKVPTENYPRVLETVERNARVQSQLIDDLLDMSRILSGKLTMTMDRLDVRNVVNAAVEAVRPQADAKGVILSVELADVAPVRGDAARLQQAVWNLITNALKFTPRGGNVKVRVAMDGEDVTITVADTGRGMSPDFLKHAFEKFRQDDSGGGRSEGGLGLGLAIVKYVIERHKGQVEANSEGTGKGSTFVLRLPSDVGVVSRAREINAAPVGLGGVRVLLIEDHPDTLEVTRVALATAGADVVGGSSATEGFALVRSFHPHVVVSDIGLPGEDGYAMMRRIRESEEEGKRVPAIALTAYATAHDRDRALDAGYDEHLAKPVDVTALIAMIERVRTR